MTTVLKGMEGVVRGYRPQVDWGGEEGSPTIVVGSHNVKLATSGWRKRCLFILLGSLLLIAVINLVLTFYLLKTIKFNTEGAGDLHINVYGVQLDGISRLDHSLTASDIQGREGEELEILGYFNMTAATLDEDGEYGSAVILDSENGLLALTKGFKVRNKEGKLLFEVKENGTKVGAKFLTITGDGGADFKVSLQTPRILGDNEVHEFRIESKTRSLTARAADLLRIESRDGDVTATSSNDVMMEATRGKFRFESPNVYMPNLIIEGEEEFSITAEAVTNTPIPENQIPAPNFEPPTPQSRQPLLGDEEITVFQVCVCPNGKLFLSSADFVCNPDEFTCR